MRSTGIFATVAVALFLVASVATSAAPAATHTLVSHVRPLVVAACTNGVTDRIRGRVVCIHVGGKCVAAHNAKYRARGFTCVNGRLQRVRKPAISIGDASAAEGNAGQTTLSVPVTLSAAARSAVTVSYSTADGTARAGSDYVAANGRVTFAPGETQKSIPLAVVGDTSIEPAETFTITLSSPVNATIAKAAATATIQNDDTAVAITAGSYKGSTQNLNYVFFTLTPARTITGFRVNDLPEQCDPGAEITGGIDFGDAAFAVDAAGSINAENTWTGSLKQGDIEWTSEYVKVTATFSTPTTVGGTLLLRDELNYQGQHYRCSSGEITWSATRQG
jgi:Calx-beta domain